MDAAEEATEGIFEDILIAAAAEGLALGAAEASRNFLIELSFNLENPRAVAYLDEYGAELVASIDETTRGYIRTIVSQGVEEGWSYNQMAAAITKRYAEFAVGRPQLHIDSRAHLIAITEIGNAYEAGNAIVVEDLQDSGLQMEKFWQTVNDARVDPECQADQDAGWIPKGDAFPSGHMRPLAHPGCRCTALYRRASA